ncbi:hypothetical protein BJ741DRAFT_122691 [Chytriomyces cf. hyalinus JEL632]|nr:hypothetical protein BJ741DRAFT_122691 [Chytriomyces cf. hyalinus JEL632]
MKRQRSDEQSGGQGATPDTASASSMSLAETNAATLSMILSTLNSMQATMAAMQNTMHKEVTEIKETQRHLLNQVLGLQNHRKKFYTRLQDVPLEIIVQIFAWIPMRTVFHYRRLSKTINECLMTSQFAVLNMQTGDSQKNFDGMHRLWIHLPPPYQAVVASAMSGRLKNVKNDLDPNAEIRLPESIARLTMVEKIELQSCNLIGCVADGIGVLQNLTHLDLVARIAEHGHTSLAKRGILHSVRCWTDQALSVQQAD